MLEGEPAGVGGVCGSCHIEEEKEAGLRDFHRVWSSFYRYRIVSGLDELVN